MIHIEKSPIAHDFYADNVVVYIANMWLVIDMYLFVFIVDGSSLMALL